MRVTRGSHQIHVGESRYHLDDAQHDEYVWASRIEFLEAIQRLAPSVMFALRDGVFAEFQKLHPKVRHGPVLDLPAAEYQRVLTTRGLKDEIICPWLVPQTFGITAVVAWRTVRAVAEELRPELMPMVGKLMNWAERFRLTHVECRSGMRVPAEWVLDAAWGTLVAWDRFQALKEAMTWHPPGLLLPPIKACFATRKSFRFSFESYNPLHESWKDFERKVHSAVLSQLSSVLGRHKLDVEADFENWRRMPNKWQREHFEWLVLFQVNGQSPGQIADGRRLPITEIAVLKGVHRAAGIIGLTPRPGRRGKGRKQI